MLVLFDVDDTLLDEAKATRAAAAALHDRLALEESVTAFQGRWRLSQQHNFDRYLSGEISFQQQRRLRIRDALQRHVADSIADDLFDEYRLSYEANWTLFDDALPCLEALGPLRLGVVSNGNAMQQRAKLSRLGIAARFDCVVLSEDVGVAKPDARIFAHACALMGVTPAETIYVGDRFDVDVTGASAAGVRPVWLNRNGNVPAFPHRFSTITTLAELPLLIQSE